MQIVTRFAPSPTGFLHIGGARTALFNLLYARAGNGKFILRVEDTDRARSTKQATDAIMNGMQWLGLDYDELIFQTDNIPRHKQITEFLLQSGKAYLDDGAVRLKAPKEGITAFDDEVYGRIEVSNAELHDVVITRSDGAPTYMLAVVVDDHDEGISHVIRGADHLTNTTLQVILYSYLGWEVPKFAHIPLIHGEDGAKLSKRHGALGLDEYQNMGFLPAAMRNYLLRLGWSHGDDEIISDEQAKSWFKLQDIGKSPACFDITKLKNINKYYIANTDSSVLLEMIEPFIKKELGFMPDMAQRKPLAMGISGLKERAATLIDIIRAGRFYLEEVEYDSAAAEIMDNFGSDILSLILPTLEQLREEDWSSDCLGRSLKTFAKDNSWEFKKVMQSLRAVLTGTMRSPNIFEVMISLGKEECIARIKAIA
ncbi:glutamate--tRNA ligase [Rickettsiales bacterium]|nr:glutamate--tRNA ligase [Rickettsiales bacterium]